MPLGATVAVAGVTVIDIRAGALTVRVVVPEMAPDAAEIVVVPAATPVASPEVLTVATAVLEDDQLAVVVRTFVLPSL